MNNQLHLIKTFKQLIFLFNAGNGEFHFLNKITNKMFNLKFIKLNHDLNGSVSLVYTCFSREGSKLHYTHIGKYGFEKKQLSLRSDPVIPEAGLRIIIDSFNYIVSSINTGEDFTDKVISYHSGKCCRCGHILTNRTSLLIGIGPECKHHYEEFLPKIQLDLFNII